MRAKNTVPSWGKAHPHGMRIHSGQGVYLRGEVQRGGEIIPVTAVDAHGQILCNSGGYGNPEVEAARTVARERTNMDATSGNFTFDIVEWARATLLESLGQEWADQYVAHLVASGTEANDTERRIAFAAGGGVAELINLRKGYSGAGFAANAACGHAPWKGRSTPSLPYMHFSDPDIGSFKGVLGDLPASRYAALMSEAGNYGVGGFDDVPDEFLRAATDYLRARGGDAYMDEVQTGIGRTGTKFWATQRIFEGMTPPAAISAAKGLGSNHRAALVFVRKDVAAKIDGLTYHTFGENLEDLAAMGTVVQIAQRDNWTQNACDRGEQLKTKLEAGKSQVQVPFELHGRGLMFGIRLGTGQAVNAVLTQAPLDGWVPGKGGLGGEILRVAPPLVITEAQTDELADAILRTLSSADVAKAAGL